MRTLFLLTSLAALALLSACAHSSSASKSSPTPATHPGDIIVSMTTTRGEIVLALDGARAPISVNNFLMHAAKGDYDGTIFHRVIPKFVIQGGGFTPDLKERAKLAEALGSEG